MIKEMQLSSNRKTKSQTINYEELISGRTSGGSAKKQNIGKLDLLQYENLDKLDASLESTFYKTNREKQTEKDDVIIENLKYFVNHSPSVQKVVQEAKKKSPSVVFNYKKDDYSLLNSIYHENNFKNQKEKSNRKFSKSLTSSKIFNYDKTKFMVNHVREMEDLIGELKMSFFDRITREIEQKTKFRDEMENNVNILSNKLKLSQGRLSNTKTVNTNLINDTTKLEFYTDRVQKELSHINMELPMLKKRIDDMKREIFEKDKDSRNLKYQIYREESEVSYLQEETRRMNKKVIDLQSEKKNLRTTIILLKKQNDLLKEKVIRENNKSKGFVSEVSALLERAKINY